MFRYAAFLWIGLASAASANIVSWSEGILTLTGGVGGSLMIPSDATLEVRPADFNFAILPHPDPLTRWVIPQVNGATTEMITEATAPSAGFDWALMESAVFDEPLELFLHFNGIGRSRLACGPLTNPNRDCEFTDIDAIRFDFFMNPREYNFSLIGPGRIIPEPSALALALCTAGLLMLRHRSGDL